MPPQPMPIAFALGQWPFATQTPQATRGNTTKRRSASNAATARTSAGTVQENARMSAGRMMTSGLYPG